MTYEHAKQRRLAEIKMLVGMDPQTLVTFNSTYKISAQDLQTRMTKFFAAIQREYYGRDWAKQMDRPWPLTHGYFEHPLTNPHYHTLVSWERRFEFWVESHGQAIWNLFDKQGQLNAVEIDEGDALKVARYCTKDLARYDRFEDIYTYKDTRPRTIGVSNLRGGKESGWL